MSFSFRWEAVLSIGEAYWQLFVGKGIPSTFSDEDLETTFRSEDGRKSSTLRDMIISLDSLSHSVGKGTPLGEDIFAHWHRIIKENMDPDIQKTLSRTNSQANKIRRDKIEGDIRANTLLPDTLTYQALVLFGFESGSAQSIKRFSEEASQKAFRIRPKGESSPSAEKKSTLDLYGEAFITTVESGKFDAKDAAVITHRNFLISICRIKYGSDFNRFVADLHALRERALAELAPGVRGDFTSFLDKVVVDVENTIAQEHAFQLPNSIRKIPAPFQIGIVLDNILHDKRICTAWMGLGKTLIADILCEHYELKRILRLVPASNREDIRDKILENVEIDPEKVIIVPDNAASLSLAQVKRSCETAKYLVCAYETLRECEKRNPKIAQYIRDWMGEDGGCVLDEFHYLDSGRSEIFKAVQGIAAKWRYFTSGTLYQDKPKNAGTIFSMAYPEYYPDSTEMRRQCSDRIKFKMFRDRHCSTAWPEDVTIPFLPFNQVPAIDQLRDGTPRMPELIQHELQTFDLSERHGDAYLKIALNYDEWLKERNTGGSAHRTTRALRQLSYMARLICNPESFSLPPPVELIAAAKDIAIPAMQNGETVLFACKHRALIDHLLADPELKRFGIVQLDGRQSTERRSELREQLNSSDNVSCAALQVSANATGSDFKSATRIIFLEVANTMATHLQVRSRAPRIVGIDNAESAKEAVHVHHLAAALSQETVNRVHDHKVRAALLGGTSHEIEHRRALAKALEYKLRLQEGFAEETGRDEITRYFDLITAHINNGSATSKRFSELTDSKDSFPDFDTIAKGKFRNEVYLFLDGLPVDFASASVIALTGPEGLEIPIYDALGVARHNIHAVEGGSEKERRRLVEKNANTGANLYTMRLEEIARYLETKFDVISADFDGYMTWENVDALYQLKAATNFAFVKNALAQRENDRAKELLEAVEGDSEDLGTARRDLDRLLLRIVGASRKPRFEGLSVHEAIKLVRSVELAAKVIADELSSQCGVSSEDFSELLATIYLGAPIVKVGQALTYEAASGQPFLGCFAYLENWPLEELTSPAACFLSNLMELHLSGSDFSAYGDKNTDSLTLISTEEISCSISSIKKLLDYIPSRSDSRTLRDHSKVSGTLAALSE